MSDDRAFDSRALELRRAFDEGFSKPSDSIHESLVDLLALRLGEEAYAIPTTELSAVHTARRIVALPGSPPSMLGLAGVRGRLVAVYDLAEALGYPRADHRKGLLLTSALDNQLALSIRDFEGYLRVGEGRIVRRNSETPARHVAGFFEQDSVTRAVLDIGAISRELLARATPRPGHGS